MKPQQELTSGYQADFFRTELSRMVNPKHPMVKVAAGMDWEGFETALEQTWHPELGRPGVSTRLMVSLNYLKYVYDLSAPTPILRPRIGFFKVEPAMSQFRVMNALRPSVPDAVAECSPSPQGRPVGPRAQRSNGGVTPFFVPTVMRGLVLGFHFHYSV
jgi:hypothetical protein